VILQTGEGGTLVVEKESRGGGRAGIVRKGNMGGGYRKEIHLYK